MSISLRSVLPLLAPVLVLLAGTAAHAETLFFANLTNSQENPPTVPTLSTGGARPVSFGSATFSLNDAGTSLTFFATVFNIDFTGAQSLDSNDNLTNAHIHAGPAVAPGVNGPVVWGFIGSPFNDTNIPTDIVVTPFATGVGGTVSGKWDAGEGNNTTLTAQLANIRSGRAYINFHTVQFGGGEVRGQILAVAPEPGSLALLLPVVGMAGMAVRRRRK